MRHLLLLICSGLFTGIWAQPTFPSYETADKHLTTYVLTNATVHVNAEVVLENAHVAIKDGVIIYVGKGLPNLQQVVTIDLAGKHLYPSFIDLDTDYGLPEIAPRRPGRGPQPNSSKKGSFGWNEAVHPEVNASEVFVVNEEQLKAYRNAGFAVLQTHVHDGIARGTAAVVTTGSEQHEALLVPRASSWLSFRKGSSTQDYPGSLMGAIALLRQTYLDADWYKKGGVQRERNLSLEAWNNIEGLPTIFEVRDRLDVLRADKIGDEFGKQYIFRGAGDEYMRLNEVVATQGKFILPLNFPKAMDVADPYNARLVSLTELKHWEMAPFNPALLHKSGIQFAFTSRGLKSPDLLFEAVRKAIDAGLPEQEALKALTTLPAEMVGIGHLVGSIEVGKVANILVSDQPIFDESARLFEHWVQGERFVLIDQSTPDLSGRYDVRMQGQLMLMEVSGKPGKHQSRLRIATLKADSSGVMQPDTLDVPAKLQQEGSILTLAVGPKENFVDGVWRFSGYVKGDQWELQGEDREGTRVELRASKTQPLTNKEREKKARQSLEKGDVIYPFMAYGWTKQPVQETLWIRHATLWTCEAEGVIEDGELLVSGGKILAVGKQIDPKKILGKQGGVVREIDATGMHISPGIIDEHSHIAISRGVNEWTETSSAEVSIGSVVDSEDIDIYRQLSGGVTAAQLLHGSANPIGGQSAIIKLRWGLSPGEMLIEGAAPFIKFALGENVKQSNSGEDYTSRFPQTRMGVEQVYYDMFIRALEYEQEWDEYEALLKDKKRASTAVPPRKDLELEVLLQILKKERFISCHSYRQDEINMLMHVADSLGFTLNTFTHILEGYKVADKMAEHGAGASSFSDWWAYKYEVKDAIPYNGAILWEHGITTAFNSDDAEMARRLNQEAAKAVKYGGVPEEEALKFVTLNPAKLLHLDERMGSLKAGKDADFVIWNAPPLSIYAVVQQTYVDGRCYFDRNADSELRASIRAERARLIQKMLDEPAEGKEKPKEKVKHRYHCDSATEELR